MKNFYIISPTYNASKYINACILSVKDQDTKGIMAKHIVVDDASADRTWEKIQSHDGSIEAYRLENNSGSPLSSFLCGISKIENLGDDDIIAWLDGDDWLLGTKALQEIVTAYRKSSADMVYSQHITYHGQKDGIPNVTMGISTPLSDPTLARYAKVAYSHFRTFRAGMLKNVPPDTLFDPSTGKHWQTCGDSALFIPMLETAKKVSFVNRPLYVYNRETDGSEDKKPEYFSKMNTVRVRDRDTCLNNKMEWHNKTYRLPPTRRFKADVGRICDLSCEFCYYSHMEKKDRWFLTWEEMEKVLRNGVARGNLFCDFSGGEPTIIPDFAKWIFGARKLGLYPCVITHGQKIEPKLEEYWDSGLEDILFSIHGSENIHNKVTNTKNGFAKVNKAIEKCNSNNFKFRTNTVLTSNFEDLIGLANYFAEVKPLISNFINFNPYDEWSCMDKQDFQGKNSQIAPFLKKAIDILTAAGVMVNIRYFPMCLLKGYEKHICNIPQVMHDGYEWDYSILPKEFSPYLEYSKWLSDRINTFAPKCLECSIRTICGGLNSGYYKNIGDLELAPYSDNELTDPLYFRVNVPPKQLNTYVGHNFWWCKERYAGLRNKT